MRWLRRRKAAAAPPPPADLTFARSQWRAYAPAAAAAPSSEARIRCACGGRHASVAEVRACSGQGDAARDFERVFGYRQAATPPF